jgi:hypothetical protein
MNACMLRNVFLKGKYILFCWNAWWLSSRFLKRIMCRWALFTNFLKQFTYVLSILPYQCIKFQVQIHYILAITKKENFDRFITLVINFIFFTALSFIGILTINFIHRLSRIERISVNFFHNF